MTEYGRLHESNGCYILRFEKFTLHHPEEVFSTLTDPDHFAEWYPFATGEMDQRSVARLLSMMGKGRHTVRQLQN
ncbi:Activator of Hsp90 ATPase-like -like protein [Lacicoccus alkaliphilus]|uniref:Activator of Hsp90 ATPase homolog 1-like protein n=1 Tax=Lacicoccus alkaliphilus DSM 16010 TaxID=1123231 RepID=A0A1M7CXE2_9BACL|nr:hypothetical protein SAMN02745189_00919 [Salinicoccus alkaliphilus DSM 16010]